METRESFEDSNSLNRGPERGPQQGGLRLVKIWEQVNEGKQWWEESWKTKKSANMADWHDKDRFTQMQIWHALECDKSCWRGSAIAWHAKPSNAGHAVTSNTATWVLLQQNTQLSNDTETWTFLRQNKQLQCSNRSCCCTLLLISGAVTLWQHSESVSSCRNCLQWWSHALLCPEVGWWCKVNDQTLAHLPSQQAPWSQQCSRQRFHAGGTGRCWRSWMEPRTQMPSLQTCQHHGIQTWWCQKGCWRLDFWRHWHHQKRQEKQQHSSIPPGQKQKWCRQWVFCDAATCRQRHRSWQDMGHQPFAGRCQCHFKCCSWEWGGGWGVSTVGRSDKSAQSASPRQSRCRTNASSGTSNDNSDNNNNDNQTNDTPNNTSSSTQRTGNWWQTVQPQHHCWQQLHQQQLHTGVPSEEDCGDVFCPKKKGFFHLTAGNIGNFNVATCDNESAAELWAFLHVTESDAHCMQEVGVNWDAMPHDSKLKHWFRSENELVTGSAHNKHGHHSHHQWGGTAILAFDQAASVVISQGCDESRLGRWLWLLFQGADNHKTQIMSVCHPCKSKKQQLCTICNQQRWHFHSLGRDGCPHQLFVRDLQEQLIKWHEDGKKLIVCIDGNKDVWHGALKDMFDQPELVMKEVISNRHPNLPVTASFCAGDRHGSIQVDGIWATLDLPIDPGIWPAFHKAPSDHQHGIVDIPWDVLLGQPWFKAVWLKARWLMCSHPHAMTVHNDCLKQQFQKHKVLEHLHDICANSGTTLTPLQCHQMERIDQVKQELMAAAKKRCHKTPMGEVAFSPEVNKARKICQLWWHAKVKCEGLKWSSRMIHHLAKSAGIWHPLSTSLPEAKWKLKEAETHYNSIKPAAGLLCNKWLCKWARDETLTSQQWKHAQQSLKVEEQCSNMHQIKAVLRKQCAWVPLAKCSTRWLMAPMPPLTLKRTSKLPSWKTMKLIFALRKAHHLCKNHSALQLVSSVPQRLLPRCSMAPMCVPRELIPSPSFSSIAWKLLQLQWLPLTWTSPGRIASTVGTRSKSWHHHPAPVCISAIGKWRHMTNGLRRSMLWWSRSPAPKAALCDVGKLVSLLCSRRRQESSWLTSCMPSHSWRQILTSPMSLSLAVAWWMRQLNKEKYRMNVLAPSKTGKLSKWLRVGIWLLISPEWHVHQWPSARLMLKLAAIAWSTRLLPFAVNDGMCQRRPSSLPWVLFRKCIFTSAQTLATQTTAAVEVSKVSHFKEAARAMAALRHCGLPSASFWCMCSKNMDMWWNGPVQFLKLSQFWSVSFLLMTQTFWQWHKMLSPCLRMSSTWCKRMSWLGTSLWTTRVALFGPTNALGASWPVTGSRVDNGSVTWLTPFLVTFLFWILLEFWKKSNDMNHQMLLQQWVSRKLWMAQWWHNQISSRNVLMIGHHQSGRDVSLTTWPGQQCDKTSGLHCDTHFRLAISHHRKQTQFCEIFTKWCFPVWGSAAMSLRHFDMCCNPVSA